MALYNNFSKTDSLFFNLVSINSVELIFMEKNDPTFSRLKSQTIKLNKVGKIIFFISNLTGT